MERLFSVPDLSGLSVEMDGLVVLDEGRGVFDFFCNSFLPWRRKRAKVNGCFNYVVIAGHQNGVEVRVYKHLHRDKAMQKLEPDGFDRRKGVEEYISNSDIYVVVAENGKERFFVLGFRLYPGSPKYGPKVNWDAYECEGLPAKIEEKADEQKLVEAEPKKIEADKPLAAHPTIPEELKAKQPEPKDGDGKKPAEQPASPVIPPAPAEAKTEAEAASEPDPGSDTDPKGRTKKPRRMAKTSKGESEFKNEDKPTKIKTDKKVKIEPEDAEEEQPEEPAKEAEPEGDEGASQEEIAKIKAREQPPANHMDLSGIRPS